MPTLANIRSRVQVRIGDDDNRKGSFGIVKIDHAIADAAIALGASLPAPEVYLSSALTIAAGDTFTLPTAAQTGFVSLTQYAGDIRIRLRSNNIFLVKITTEEMDARKNGRASAPGSVPEVFSLWEEMDNDVQGRCDPPAKAAEVCDLFVSLQPDDIRDADDMDAANVRFSRLGSLSLVAYTSALLVAQMDEEDMKLRRLNPGIVTLWLKEAADAIYREEVRRNNEESVGRTQRWVS